VSVPRLAKVFDGRDERGRPVLAADRPRLVDAEERRRVLAFLDGGFVLLSGGPLIPDELHPDRPRVVPVGYATDGVWIWSATLRHYVAEHGISPESDFLAHVRRCGYRTAVPSAEQVEQAGAELQAFFRRAASDAAPPAAGR
jgi:hypothetical protein